MVLFECPACAKPLRVKPELAGKKVKCPKCGQTALVPAETPSPVPAGNAPAGGDLADEKTRAPQVEQMPEAATMPPADARTVAPAAHQAANLTNPADATIDSEEDRSLIDFLAPPQEPDEIGRLGMYRVLKVLGAGGMGVVYKAEDPGLKRLVAIKAMLPAIAASAAAKKRFLREAQAAAAIKHNHIVTIFQVGEDRGVPFLAMEFLRGEPLDERLKRETKLSPAETMRIGREMAEGMAAAHELGLIHRDIKPANTWLETRNDKRPRLSGAEKSTSGTLVATPPSHVKILDFGLARSETDNAHITQSGAIVGTPAYMSPEQGRGAKLDARCDLWSLGVVLYRMCTGELPFKGADTVSTLMAVAMTEPPAPTQVEAGVPAGLSDLVMKLLQKDPDKRPASAHDVADSLRVLEQEALATKATAAPVTKAVQMPRKTEPSPKKKTPTQAESAGNRGKSKSRKPMLLGLTGGLLALLAAAIVFFWPTQGGVIRVEINDPEIEAAFIQDGLTFKGKDKQTIKVTPDKEVGLRVQRGDLDFHTDKIILKNGETIALKIEWFQEGKLRIMQGDSVIGEKALAKKIETAVAPPPAPAPAPPEPRPDAMVQKFVGHTGKIWSAALTGDGRFAVTGSMDKTAILWDTASGKKIQTFQHDAIVTAVAVTGDGKRVFTGGTDNIAFSWDAASGGKVHTFTGHAGGINSMALARDGKRLITGSRDKTAILWDAATGKSIQTFQGHSDLVVQVALSPDGQRACTASYDNTAAQWDIASGKKLLTFEGHSQGVNGVALSGDGKHLLTGSRDKTAILWDVASAKIIHTFTGHGDEVLGVALSRDGRFAVTGSKDRTAILWDSASGQKLQTFEGHADLISEVAFADEGRRVLTGSGDGTAILWAVKVAPPSEPQSDAVVQKFLGHNGKVWCVALSADGKRAATATWDGTAILWDTAKGSKIQTFKGHADPIIYSVALSPDGKLLLTGSKDKTAILWDTASGEKIRAFEHAGFVSSVAFSRDGKHALTGSGDKTAVLWDVASGKKTKTFAGHAAPVTSVALGADGKVVLTGSDDKTAILWDGLSAGKIQTFVGHAAIINVVVLSGDGKLILTGATDRTAILWDAATGNKLQTFTHSGRVNGAALSGDGKRAFTASWDKTAVAWDVASGDKLHTFKGHTDQINDLAQSGDGKLLLTGSDDGTAILWEIKAPPLAVGSKFINSLGMEFALVPKGKAWLGGGNGKEGTNEVNMAQDFYLGVYDVTQQEWQKVMGGNPSYYNRERVGKEVGDDELRRFPVENVTWEQVQSFVKQVNETLKKDAREAGWEYRLPTEEQWEYACRGGPMTNKAESAFHFYFEKPTNVLSKGQANFNASGLGRPCAVGSYPPNRLGLYDMHGNVSQWCEDRFEKGNPPRAIRGGGGWWGDAEFCTATHRTKLDPDKSDRSLSFRLARVPAGTENKTADPGKPAPAAATKLQTLQGHTDKVWCVALNGDGKFAASGSFDGTAILWDALAGKKLQTFDGHTSRVYSVAISADGTRVLTGSDDKTAILWDAKSGGKIQTFVGHAGPISTVALSRDGKHVLTGAEDNMAFLWDVSSGKKIQTCEGHTGMVVSVALSGDGQRVLTGSADKTASLWDRASGKKVQTFTGHADAIYIVALSRDGKRVLTGSIDKTAILWDAVSGSKVQSFLGHADKIYGAALSGDARHVFTASWDNTAIMWDAANGAKLHVFQGHAGHVNDLSLSGDGKLLLTASDDRTAILWAVPAAPPPAAGQSRINPSSPGLQALFSRKHLDLFRP